MPTYSGPMTGGSDFLSLDPSAAPARGLTSWLTAAVATAVADGSLQVGAALPATRVLARDLGISRGVVTEAYQRLTDAGLIGGRPGAGTRVLANSPGTRTPIPPMTGPAMTGPAGVPARRDDEPVPGYVPAVVPLGWRGSAEIDMSPGVPDLSGFPRTAWSHAERAVLSTASAAELGYGDPRGAPALRSALAGWLARTRGVRAEPDDIIVVSGVAQALALLAQRLGGAAVAIEDPGSRGSRDELAYWGLTPVPVPTDDQGIRDIPDGIKAVAVTPAHQFPTGVVLSPSRRRALIDWATTAGGLIIEDDYDAEYRYDRAPVPALQGAAPERVAYAGSVSKTLAPGMRIGWLVPPRSLHADLVRAKHFSDLGCPVLPQLVLAQLIADGTLERHIRQVRNRLRQRRDALLGALRDFLPAARVAGVAAGLHLLVTFPSAGFDDTEAAARVLRSGVLIQPLSLHRSRPGPPGFVLGYAACTPDRLREGGRRIADALLPSEKYGRGSG
jgi:GntR family transcriptional regulator / MocR family aminotransferase